MFEQMAGFWCLMLAGASVVYPTSRQPSVVRRTFRERKVSMILITPAAVRSLFIAIERRAQQEGKGELFARLRRIARKLPMALRRLLFFTVHSQFGGRFRYIVSGGAASTLRWARPGGGWASTCSRATASPRPRPRPRSTLLTATAWARSA